jgi:hypothetical protein
VAGTLTNWGSSSPASLIEVLNHHKNQFEVEPSTPTPVLEPEEAAAPDWAYQVYEDGYGGYYYLDENEGYHACDGAGNDLETGDE